MYKDFRSCPFFIQLATNGSGQSSGGSLSKLTGGKEAVSCARSRWRRCVIEVNILNDCFLAEYAVKGQYVQFKGPAQNINRSS